MTGVEYKLCNICINTRLEFQPLLEKKDNVVLISGYVVT